MITYLQESIPGTINQWIWPSKVSWIEQLDWIDDTPIPAQHHYNGQL